jgi:hypothetical protein
MRQASYGHWNGHMNAGGQSLFARLQQLPEVPVSVYAAPMPSKQSLLAALVCTMLVLAGCRTGSSESEATAQQQQESRSVELDKAERVRVELNMPAGELEVRGGSQKLMDGDFRFSSAGRVPEVRYRSAGSGGDLTVEQSGPLASGRGVDNEWDLKFNEKVPMDFRVKFGAGEARLNMGSLTLQSVEIEIGAGELQLDLRGKPVKDYSVRVRGGVGEAVIHLPKDVGISAAVAGGLGDISVSGLEKVDDRYVNAAFRDAPVKIRLDVKGGVGAIRLIAD